MRPPMLAGPILRQTKRLSMGSVDQLMGVGVGLGLGLWEAAAVGAGV